MKPLLLLALVPLAAACATYTDVKELKMIGFSDDISKGKAIGEFESDDCVYRVLGYSLGGAPELSRAIANARTQKKSSVGDVVGQGEAGGAPLRYAANITTSYGGFDAVVFGKSCIQVKGMGYL